MTTPSIRIGAVGDIMIARDVQQHFLSSPDDFKMEEIVRELAINDFVLGNLETPVSRRGEPHHKQDPHVTFCADPACLEILKILQLSAVTLANNHMLDFGPDALVDTRRHLDEVRMPHFGAGPDYHAANAPLLTEVNGVPIAFLGTVYIYSSSTERAGRKSAGLADWRIGPLLEQIRSLKAKGYLVVVTVHWGLEYSFFPVQYQVRQARKMIDEGATLILGHGPHYPQGIERYKDGEIVYSLGNFIFDEPQWFAKRSFIYSARIANAAVVESSISPVRIENHLPVLLHGSEAKKLARLVFSLNKIYARKGRDFWKAHSNLYFRDIFQRVAANRSLKFLKLPTLGFYRDVGLANYWRKIASRFSQE